MNPSAKVDSTTSTLPKYHNPYTKMQSRRAIACTICAKAKTKCDKLVPSCSRCTAKGLQCEPRSTRRTSDNSSYRHPRKISPPSKRYVSTNHMTPFNRHKSPTSVPPPRHQLVRTVSQMGYPQATKYGQQRQDFPPMLTPLPTEFQVIDGYYPSFTQPIEKNKYLSSGRLTPQTPESVAYSTPVSIMDPFDQPMTQTNWSYSEGQGPIGLGFEDEMPELMGGDADLSMWPTQESDVNTSLGPIGTFETPLCGSPSTMHAWSNQTVSDSSPHHDHTRSVPSLSISESSQEFDSSPNTNQDEWSTYMGHQETSTPYFDGMKAMSKAPQMFDGMLVRSAY